MIYYEKCAKKEKCSSERKRNAMLSAILMCS